MTNSKTVLHLSFNMVDTSGDIAQTAKRVKEFEALARQTGLADFSFNCHSYNEANSNGSQSDVADGRDLGRARSEAGERARQDFEGDAPAEAPADAGDAPKRGRGRPRKQRDGDGEAGSGSAPVERKRSGDAEGGEGRGRNVRDRTDEGTGEGSGEGQGRARGAGADRGDQRGNSGQARISTGEDRGEAPTSQSEWDDAAPAKDTPRRSKDKDDGPEHHAKVPDKDLGDRGIEYVWPDHLMPETVDADTLGELLADHFAATGGKDRQLTFDIMEKATGVRKVSDVNEDDYDNLAAGLLKDAARHKFGIKATTVK